VVPRGLPSSLNSFNPQPQARNSNPGIDSHPSAANLASGSGLNERPPFTSSGRRELADWIASPANPLTARVIVNRVWLHLFGQGLVATPDNFGLSGQAPSNPELLDHLATRFVQQGCNAPLESLALFDMASGTVVTGQRPQTTIPAQSL
jgi:hypothetical protein